MDVNQRISNLRALMKQHQLDAYIIPSADPHLSEDLADHYKSREYFSGFDGSAGTLVVTLTESGLWTDGRYFIQAEAQLANSEIKLFKMYQPNVLSVHDYLASVLRSGQTVGCDGWLFAVGQIEQLKETLEKKEIMLNPSIDLVTDIWDHRKALPATPIFMHDKIYTGLTTREKLTQLRELLKKEQADGTIINLLGSVAWLFNIRAQDISYNPMVISYAVVLKESAYLFVNQDRMPDTVKEELEQNGVTIKAYDEIENFLNELPSLHLICDRATLNYALYDLVKEQRQMKISHKQDLVTDLKAIKNECEIKNTDHAQIKDGCALVAALCHIEQALKDQANITEYDVVGILDYYRRLQPLSYGSSFQSIVGYLENAAMMHYHPTKQTSKRLEQKGLLLIDSGGQYLDGTTDITRTFVLGETTDEEKKHYTLVLKAHIGLSQAIFLKGCTGGNLDILSRQALYAHGLDYRCGTGHGVAYFGAVHEGPQGFGLKSTVELLPGMMLTNEPGIYIEGKHGIRIENTLLVVKQQETDYGQFYRFDVISYFPIDTKALMIDMLTESEINWLNDYHQLVFNKLAPQLTPTHREWLMEKTKPI